MQSFTTTVFQDEEYESTLHNMQAHTKHMRIILREEFGVEEFQRKFSANSSNSDRENHQHII